MTQELQSTRESVDKMNRELETYSDMDKLKRDAEAKKKVDATSFFMFFMAAASCVTITRKPTRTFLQPFFPWQPGNPHLQITYLASPPAFFQSPSILLLIYLVQLHYFDVGKSMSYFVI